MSTGLIIAIVVIALILIALFAFVLPRARKQSQVRAREKELEQRRDRVAGEHRAEAGERERQASMAEQKAREAELEAKRERAEAELHQERAQRHESGMADHELIADDEREKFADTSAMRNDPDATPGEDAHHRGSMAATPDQDDPNRSEYEQGRVDERQGRFDRDASPETTDETTRPRPA